MTDLQAKAREIAYRFQAAFWHPDRRVDFSVDIAQDIIATALLEARREARKAALEEAAKVAEDDVENRLEKAGEDLATAWQMGGLSGKGNLYGDFASESGAAVIASIAARIKGEGE